MGQRGREPSAGGSSSPLGLRNRASPLVAQKRSRLSWAASGVSADMVRHQRPVAKRTAASTQPLAYTVNCW